VYLPPENQDLSAGRDLIDDLIYFCSHERIQIKNRSGAALSTPLRLKLNISYMGLFSALSAQSGAVQ